MNQQIKKNSRQIPSSSSIIKEKDYCDLLYAWIQCNSERTAPTSQDRRIPKKMLNWSAIERDFTRPIPGDKPEKVMSRKTISKYYDHLKEKGLLKEQNDGYVYLTLLNPDEANLIEYNTLSKLLNVLQKNSLSIYIYLFNRYYANGRQPYIATIKQIKEFIGIATTTTSNNLIVSDTIDILKRLKLLDYKLLQDEQKTYFEFQWVSNVLPE